MSRLPPSPNSSRNWQDWANQMVEYIQDTAPSQANVSPRPVLLEHQVPSVLSRATTDGILMYNPDNGYMVISKGGEWIEIPDSVFLLTNYVLVAHGGMRQSGTDIAGADIGLAYQTLTNFDVEHVPEVRTTFDTTADTFAFNTHGVFQTTVSLSFAHDNSQAGRTTNVRFYNVTDDAPSAGVTVGIGRNVEQTTVTLTLYTTVDASNVNKVLRIEIGGGDLITLVSWDAQAVATNNVGSALGTPDIIGTGYQPAPFATTQEYFDPANVGSWRLDGYTLRQWGIRDAADPPLYRVNYDTTIPENPLVTEKNLPGGRRLWVAIGKWDGTPV